MKKTLLATLAAAAALCTAGAAQAHGNVYWSIGVNLPPVGTVISNAPVYSPAPVVYAPPPVVYAPAPVVYAPAPVWVRPAPVIYGRPVPMGYAPWGWQRGWDHGRHGYERRERYGYEHRDDRDFHDDRKFRH